MRIAILVAVLSLGLSSSVYAQRSTNIVVDEVAPVPEEEAPPAETPVEEEAAPVVEEDRPTRSFVSDDQSDGQRAVAEVLDDHATDPGFRDVVDELRRLSPDEQADAFDEIGPGRHDAMTEGGFEGTRRHQRRVGNHMDDARIGRAADVKEGDDDADWTPWVDASLSEGDGRSTTELGGYDLTGMGFSGGVDYGFGESFLLGFTYGVDRTKVKFDDSSSEGEVDGMYYGTYLIFFPGRGFVQLAIDQAEHAYESDRHIQFGQINRVARSEHDGSGQSAFLGSGYEFRPGKWRISPRASVQYITLDQDAYTEDGAGSLDLSVDEQEADSVEGSLGVRVDYAAGTKLCRIRPHVMLGWGRQFERGSREITASLEGTEKFTLFGPESDEDTVEVGTGVTATFLGWSVFAKYGAAFDADSQSQAVDVGFRSRF